MCLGLIRYERWRMSERRAASYDATPALLYKALDKYRFNGLEFGYGIPSKSADAAG